MKPTENQIKDAIKAIKKRMADPAIELKENEPIKEGYYKSLEILSNPNNGWNYWLVNNLKTEQSRAIAIITIDFLNGECSHKVLCNVPFKTI